ncbi:hypothetical protein COOONC_06189 [Cooperia oncophora]
MSEWAAFWGLTINLNKCSLLHLGDNVSPRYEINGAFLEGCIYPKTKPNSVPKYEERLKWLGLLSLKERRPCSERSGSFGLSYLKIQKRFYSIMFNSYFYRMARMLDKLPPELLRSENGKVFKNRLRKICITDSLHSLF